MAVIPLRVHRMKKKLEKMQLKERLIYGYGRVILRMIVSGVLSLIVIGLLMGNMLRYVENVERAGCCSENLQDRCQFCGEKYP